MEAEVVVGVAIGKKSVDERVARGPGCHVSGDTLTGTWDDQSSTSCDRCCARGGGACLRARLGTISQAIVAR